MTQSYTRQKPFYEQKIQKTNWQHQNSNANFDDTTIADWL